MAYCKYCGMHGNNRVTCEWCARELPRPSHTGVRPMEASQSVAQESDDFGDDSESVLLTYETIRLASPFDEGMPPPRPVSQDRSEVLLDFLIYLGALGLVGSGLIAWHFGNPFIWVAIGCTFITGVLLAVLRTIPAFEEGWHEVDLPVVLMLAPFVPLLVVYLGYIAYGMTKRRIARTVFWLLGALCMTLLALLGVSAIAGVESAPVRVYSQFRGLELLCLTAILLGWSMVSWRRLLAT